MTDAASTPVWSPSLAELTERVPLPAGADIQMGPVLYDHAGTELEGLLARDASARGRRPAVVVVHDWFGVGGHVAARIQMLARLGYVAFAADVYGRDVRPGPADAAEVAGAYYADLPLMRARVRAAIDRVAAEPDVDPARIAVMGYCFGGSAALEVARAGAPVKAAVSLHGSLVVHEPADVAGIEAALLVLTGADDPLVPDDRVAAFQAEMRTRPAVDWQVVAYSGAMHAFSVPGVDSPDHGAQYQDRAERRSWRALTDFLAEHLG
ncbi:dienelactone hydrolase [Clavibacter michiganensis]|uniref:Dienelactone hydrolase n=2 Tax=Clavibacter michiganensis TaxID=28447 RepID=A0A2S5VTV0_9MICO|nr:dienelactone hydrolase family protein [Clavibacter michiganensis]PPF67588.1 dienelactone hydrolase [Clavibacter michiganensis]